MIRLIAAAMTAALMSHPLPAMAQSEAADDYGPQDPAAGPLMLEDVLRASARSSPQIIEALAGIRKAQGTALKAEGAFDTVFGVEGRSRVTGYYDGTIVEGKATRPFVTNGGYAYGGYRVSRGDFPIYEDKSFTNELGEFKLGALYSLVRDRLIDERRAQRSIAASGIDIARFEAQAAAIGVQSRAITAYQQWVAAGLRLRAYRDLLELAESRTGAINRQVELGSQPRILRTENEQNLVRRRALVIEAEQAFGAAAARLALYYRDASGEPIIVGAGRLPESSEALDFARPDPEFSVEQRPELQSLLAQVEQSTLSLALAENALKPRFDLTAEVGKDIGDEGLGGPSRTPFETIVGFRFSVPLQNRAAKGRIAETEAGLDQLAMKQKYLRDQIRTEVDAMRIAVEGAERLVGTSRQEYELARELANAERRRFQLGSSDFFLVNQREETATNAQIQLIDAQARIGSTRAGLAAATADRSALGLGLDP
ncbi:TolC family protein [Croceicoccus mobilis]|uniref:Multidrug transporter n=1 Tax=Croceicoccus mobilis TaxID=1703339 RepID=A0A916YUY1_9SPHN|nr:TolC family protein [Croceicoccus mobilis]GGD62389.1 multidrug transporter [Croceicoccus mobilis]